ncbi:MAG: hypothetical protein ACLSBB_11305 [Ruthenibacterium lactatiformans]
MKIQPPGLRAVRLEHRVAFVRRVKLLRVQAARIVPVSNGIVWLLTRSVFTASTVSSAAAFAAVQPGQRRLIQLDPTILHQLQRV